MFFGIESMILNNNFNLFLNINILFITPNLISKTI